MNTISRSNQTIKSRNGVNHIFHTFHTSGLYKIPPRLSIPGRKILPRMFCGLTLRRAVKRCPRCRPTIPSCSSFLTIDGFSTELAEIAFVSTQPFSAVGTFVEKKIRDQAGECHNESDYKNRVIQIAQQHQDKSTEQQSVPQFPGFFDCHFHTSATPNLPVVTP